MYFVTEIYGGHDLGSNSNIIDAAMCQEMYTCPKQTRCIEFLELAYCLKPDLHLPYDAFGGFKLCNDLISLYEQEVV